MTGMESQSFPIILHHADFGYIIMFMKLGKEIPLQRQRRICALLEERQFIRSSALSELLGISEATVRRDLELMERHGQIERVHGGAVLSRLMVQEPPYPQSIASNSEEKNAIGKAAVSFIEPNDVIFLNQGTTTEILARHMAGIPEEYHVTVVTSNLNVVRTLHDSAVTTIALGGIYRAVSESFSGASALRTLDGFNATKAFLGVDGISMKFGCTMTGDADAEVSRRMIQRTFGKIYVVADHTKWGTVSPYCCAPLDQVHAFITGKVLSSGVLEGFGGLQAEIVRG